VCNAGRLGCVITASGDVTPCALIPTVLGNVTERPFSEIWAGSAERARIDALTWADLPECRACDLMPWCRRCHGAALLETGSLTGRSSSACTLARIAQEGSLSTPRTPSKTRG
jgi:radical SAM protein with 4Fe4S-binding SPASM domain